MRIRARLIKYLEDRGFFPEQADTVMDSAAQKMPEMKDRWSDNEEDYPPSLFAVLFIRVDAEAIAWIDANCPKHWARSVFTRAAAENTP